MRVIQQQGCRKSSVLQPIEAAVLKTLLYADIFNYAMTPREIHHFLIHGETASLEAVQTALTSPTLARLTEQRGGYVALRASLISTRIEREAVARRLLPVARRYGFWLARLPFVRMVALTGALAVHNAPDERDDLDYLLVTAPGRVWLARAMSIVLVRIVKLRGIVLCPNYVLDESALAQERHDLFIAHELAQMMPLYGHTLYQQMREINGWSAAHLPNAGAPFEPSTEFSEGCGWNMLKRALEWLLGGRLGDALESWEHRRKLRRFARDMRTPRNAARLDNHQVKGHFQDHGYIVLERYAERLRQYGLELESEPAPGD